MSDTKPRAVYEFTLSQEQFGKAAVAYFQSRGLLPDGEFEVRTTGEPESPMTSMVSSHITRDYWSLQFWSKP